MFSLSQLKAPKGSTRTKKRIGRGQGSGWGKTAGRGGKGQKARTGNMHFNGFEGGQMPLQRRMPKYGFKNFFRRDYAVINVGDLDAHFEVGAVVDAKSLKDAGLMKDSKDGLKVLGAGELKKALTIKAHKVSVTAKAAIEKAGGKVELIAEKQLKIPARGEGVRARIAKERAARRAAKKKA
ncbi:MAG: 50S ribosomal protein L15 [Deltaproteobacteria bacterium]|nr:50S ribosomal protein L15 [Deltaproteobacteria bacterium]